MLDLLRQTSVPIDSIRIDGGTQSRVRIDPETVADYADAMQAGAEFPPVIVYYDGEQYWLADGFHRLQAWVSAWPERTGIPAEVRQGDKREAVLHSVGANDAHGLRRTNEDKRRAVLRLLEDGEWGTWSDREIARRCNVNHEMVGKLRLSLTGGNASERTYTTKHGTTATMQTANIGQTRRNTDLHVAIATGYIKELRGGKWREMADNQIIHANSPSYQEFAKRYPEIPDHKAALQKALEQLRAMRPGNPGPQIETPAPGRPMMQVFRTEEERDADERGRSADAAVAMVQAEADALEWPRLQGWHRALVVAFSELTEAAPIAESYGFGVETERLLAELRALREEVKRLTPGDRLR